MRRLPLIGLFLLVAFAGPVAWAQDGSAVGKPGSSSVNTDKTRPDAPVGHRQPRASALPSQDNLSDPKDAISREDAALDRKIKSICRGC